MITFPLARRIATAHVPPDCGLLDETTRERPSGWYFAYQSHRYLQSRDFRHMLVGSGGLMVNKETGDVFEFGSAYPLERNFAAYEWGMRSNTNDLTITAVHDLPRALDSLLKLRLSYAIPEAAHGRTWRIPRSYDRAQLQTLLQSLPHTFPDYTGLFFDYETFLEIDATRCLTYALSPLPEKPRA